MKRRFLGYWRHYYNINKGIFFLIVLVILVSLFPREGKFKYEFQRGKPWQHEELIAPFDFAIRKTTDELKREQQEVLNDAYLFFRFDTNVSATAINQFRTRFEESWKKTKGESPELNMRERNNLAAGLFILDSVYRRGILEPTTVLENINPDSRIAVIHDNIADIQDLKYFFTIRSSNDFLIKQVALLSG
ncbi:MAG: hypothetical protein IPH88_12790 [Bacteroidales bacterium]|nr:hypothetical protein [Bacteroidales bacterium]